MTIKQTLQSSPNGVIWSRREGGVTYFLRKIATGYEAWTSLDTGSKNSVTLDQATTYYSQHNLVNSTAAAPRTVAAPVRPAPPPPPPPPRPSADERLQSIRNGGGIINVNANLSIIYEDGQYLAFNPRNVNLADLRLRTAAEIKNGNASPLTVAQARTAITTGAKLTTTSPANTRAPAAVAKPVTAPAKTTSPTNKTTTPASTPKAVTQPAAVTTPAPTTAPNPILKTRPEPIAITADVDPITGRTEPISVTSGDPALAIVDEPLITDGFIEPPALDEELVRLAGAAQDQFIFQARKDWRVRLALSDAPEVNYLYRAANPGILNPLNATNGVLFPYTPIINVNYSANYSPTDLVHSNYKVFQYSSSSVDSISISCDFTAQDTYEANYLLAVIHFFKSATKMFYGQDENPRKGTPPPLCYIYGMGSYQFAGQPLAISQFSYSLPNNVDYIKTSVGGDTTSASTQPTRMAGTGVAKGGVLPPPNFIPTVEPDTVSWVPSKIQLQITCVPMLSRNQVSNNFSLEKYATGELLNGIGKPGGGFW